MRYNPTMRILILSPLFPPDPGDQAVYVKELAEHLSEKDTSLLIYGYLPEKLEGTVAITAVDKRRPLLWRLTTYTILLYKKAKEVDLIIINNAPSTEVPALLVSFFYSKKMLLCESDPLAAVAAKSGFYKAIHTLMVRRCHKIITLPEKSVYEKQELLPFSTLDPDQTNKRAAWWTTHLNEITSL
jgi:hypothetical protein